MPRGDAVASHRSSSAPACSALASRLLVFALYASIIDDPRRPVPDHGARRRRPRAPDALVGRSGQEPSRREALLGCLLLWSLVPAVGILPYVLGAGMTPLNALFESMSGFTATGATAIGDFEAVPAALFMWRAFTQWVGGIGIVVVFVAVFPQLAIAGRQIFHAELPGPTEERITPRLRSTALAVLSVYVGSRRPAPSRTCLAGMAPYEAVAHAFTTVAAAGFSPEARSFEAYGVAVDWVAITFMTLAAVNFALLFRAFIGRPRDLLRDPELRAYALIVLIAGSISRTTSSALRGERGAQARLLPDDLDPHHHRLRLGRLRRSGPTAPAPTLVLLMFVGGSAGSAAGGIKVMRWLIIGAHTVREVQRALHPRAILPLTVGVRAPSPRTCCARSRRSSRCTRSWWRLARCWSTSGTTSSPPSRRGRDGRQRRSGPGRRRAHGVVRRPAGGGSRRC
jgi:trk system potassium uptake protein